MNQKNKQLITVAVIILAVAVVVGVKAYMGSQTIDTVSGRTKGNSDAPVKVVEFIDFQCPACAVGAKMLNAWTEKHPEQIQLEMKYFPLKMHAHAFLSARFAECAARQQKFWEFHDKLIYSQNDWSKVINAYPAFYKMAQEVGLDMNQIQGCLNDSKIDKVINEHQAEGKKRGVRSTPTYFVNDEIIVGPRDLNKKIQELVGNPVEGGQGGQN